MTVFRNLFMLLLTCSSLAACGGTERLAQSLGVADLPASIQVTEHWEASGPDPYELWQLAPLTHESLNALVRDARAAEPTKRATSECLGLENSDAPNWWPSRALEDASWDYTSTPYALYVAAGHPTGRICIYSHSTTGVTYVQLFGA